MRSYWGYLSVLLATALFGLWNSFNKILLNYLNPITITALVYIIATFTLIIIRISPINKPLTTLLNKNCEAETTISRKEYGILILTAIFGAFLAPIIFLYGLNQITAVNASLLMNVEILFTVFIGITFFKERFVKQDIIGFLFIIIGTIFLATNGKINNFQPNQLIGTILIIIASALWSIDTNLSKFLSNKSDLIKISSIKCGIGGLCLLTLAIITGQNLHIPGDAIPYLFFIGVMILGFTFILIYYGIRIIGSIRTGSLFAFTSLFGAIFAFLILGEPFTITQIFFATLMLIGVYIFYRNEIS